MSLERDIQREVRLLLGSQPDLVVWRNQVGVAAYYDAAGREQRIPYGLCPGSSDIVGVMGPAGRFVAIEVKTPTGRLSKKQTMFLELVRAMGGFASVVRSVDDAHKALARARGGESQ